MKQPIFCYYQLNDFKVGFLTYVRAVFWVGVNLVTKLIIEGARKLEGEITLQGAKNSILPIMAATLVCDGECVIHNCPKISDVDITIDILKFLGCSVTFEDGTVSINTMHSFKTNIPDYLMRALRSSIIFLGAIISKFGGTKICLPGGCELGPRPIDLHLEGLRQMGLRIIEKHGFMECDTPRGMLGTNISLSFPSVGATENLILAAVKADGTTILSNAAREPEIVDLANFLIKCGAKISGAGGSTITIEGVKKLYGCEYTIIPDRIVAVTYMAAAAACRGSLVLKNVVEEHMTAFIPIFEESGCTVKFSNSSENLTQEALSHKIVELHAPERLSAVRLVRTMPYPGFPTDAQAIIMAMLCLADGSSMFVENIFESRYNHVGELIRLGADIKVEGRAAIVNGVKQLSGAHVKATDLRGDAALIVAGLAAEGISELNCTCHLDRGYENIEKNLTELGAKIFRSRKGKVM